MLLHACYKADHLLCALQLFNDMISHKIIPPESAFYSLIQCYSDAGDIESALGLIKQMKEIGIEPRFRSYQPILDYTCKQKDITRSVYLATHMLRCGIVLQSEQLADIISTVSKSSLNELLNTIESIDRFIEQISQIILGLDYEDMRKVVMSFNNMSYDDVVNQGIEVESFDGLHLLSSNSHIISNQYLSNKEESTSNINVNEENTVIALNSSITSTNIHMSEITKTLLLSNYNNTIEGAEAESMSIDFYENLMLTHIIIYSQAG